MTAIVRRKTSPEYHTRTKISSEVDSTRYRTGLLASAGCRVHFYCIHYILELKRNPSGTMEHEQVLPRSDFHQYEEAMKGQ